MDFCPDDCECRDCRERRVRHSTRPKFWNRMDRQPGLHRDVYEEHEESCLFERLLSREMSRHCQD